MISNRKSAGSRPRIFVRALGAIALLVLGVPSVSAVTLTFDSQLPGTGVENLHEQGFEVQGTGGRHYLSSGGSAFCMPACPNNGGNHLLAFGAAFDIAPVSGLPFTLVQLDIAESHEEMPQYWAQAVRVVGIFSDNSTLSVDLFLDLVNDGDGSLDDFQTERLPATFSNLASVRIEGIGGELLSGYSVDNIVVTDKPTTKLALPRTKRLPRAVPEPSTMVLIALALAWLGIVRGPFGRRRIRA